ARRPLVFDIACRSRATDKRRRFAFSARVGPPQLRQGGRRFTPFGLPEKISERFGNSGRAAATVNLQPLRSEPDWHSAKRFAFTFWSRRPQGDGYSFAHEDVDLSFVDLVNCSHGGFDV